MARDGAYQRQARPHVVHLRAQHQRRTPPRLLAAGLRVGRQSDKIPGVRHKRRSHQDSPPCGCPQIYFEYTLDALLAAGRSVAAARNGARPCSFRPKCKPEFARAIPRRTMRSISKSYCASAFLRRPNAIASPPSATPRSRARGP
jgi:hypothetical protein